MSTLANFPLTKDTDNNLDISIVPAVSIGGWSMEFEVQKNFWGSSGLILKSVSSGLNGASGITVTDSGQGQLRVRLNAVDSSGLAYGAYAYQLNRTNSGFQTVLSEGYISVQP